MRFKVEIIIPYWGDFKLLKEAVDSVLTQSSSRWKLTILDDHYPDKSAYNFYKKNPKIKYIRHSKNLGITKNFNFAIKTASEKYCIIMGCDDRLLPDFIQKTVDNIRQDSDLFLPSVEVIDSEGNTYLPMGDKIKRLLRLVYSRNKQQQRIAKSLCIGNWFYFPSIVWSTSNLKKYKFNESYRIVMDLNLLFDMLIDGCNIQIDKSTTFQYRRFGESLSSKESAVRFEEERLLYNFYSKRFKSIGWTEASIWAKLHPTSRLNKLLTGWTN